MSKAKHCNSELKNLMNILIDVQHGKNRTLELEHVIHRKCKESIEQIKEEIFERKNKILENLSAIYEREFLKLEKALQNENLDYSSKCFDIQKQNQMLLAKIQAAQEILESSNQESIARTTQEIGLVVKQLHLDNERPPQTRRFRLHHGDISNTNISNLLGNVYLETDMVSAEPDVATFCDVEKSIQRNESTDLGKRKQMEDTTDSEYTKKSDMNGTKMFDSNQQHSGGRDKTSGMKQMCQTETNKSVDCSQQTDAGKDTNVIQIDVKKVHANTQRCHTEKVCGLYHNCMAEKSRTVRCNDYQRQFDSCEVADVRLQSMTEKSKQSSNVLSRRTVKVKGRDNFVKVIVPMENNRMWIAVDGHRHLLLINSSSNILTKGRIAKESKEIGNIVDAKRFNSNILVTCGESNILQLSKDGQSTSIFTDLNTYRSIGLCVTQCLEVLVCVQRSADKNKVVRLDKTGGIIQIFHQDSNSVALFSCPDRVVSLSTGEIVVTERDSGRVVGVNNEGRHLFTLTGNMIGENGFRPSDITNDKNDNVLILDDFSKRVLVINKEGVLTKRLGDETHCMASAHTISVSTLGQLIIGCNYGNIAIITY